MEAYFLLKKNIFVLRLSNIYELNRTSIKLRCIDGHYLIDCTPMSDNGELFV